MRRLLAALGYQETINFSFVEESWERDLAGNADPIRLLNPIASQMSVMRSSLMGSLLQVLKFNLDRKADAGARVRAGPRVPARCGRRDDRQHRARHPPADAAWRAWPTATPMACNGRARAPGVDFFDVKGDVEALLSPLQAELQAGRASGACIPAAAPRVWLDGREIGVVGELHPRWRQKLGVRACADAVRTRPRRGRRSGRCRCSSRCPSSSRRSATSRSWWPTTSRMTR